MSGQFTNTGYLLINSPLITTFPSDVVFFMNEASVADSPIFYQGTASNDRNIAGRTVPASDNLQTVHRNTGGPQGIAQLNYTRAAGWHAVRLRFLSTSRAIAIDGAANTASDATVIANDLALHNQVFLGSSFNGQLAEYAVFNGTTVSDADYDAYRAGTKLIENIAGVTYYDSMLTFPGGATSRTAGSGQVFSVNGAVSQGASHPITRASTAASGATLTGASTIVPGSASGASSGVAAGATLTGISTINAGMATAMASLTTRIFRNNTGTPLANQANCALNIYNATTGVLVLRVTGQTTTAAGRLIIPDAALVSGTTYAYELDLTAASLGRRLPLKAAA